MAFSSLRQRLIFVLLLPVAVFLAGMGVAGFFYARHSLLEQWQNSALLSLERAAHAIDMGLSTPSQVVELLGAVAGTQDLNTRQWEQSIAQAPGVERVSLSWNENPQSVPRSGAMGAVMGLGMAGRGRFMTSMHARIAKVANPRFDTSSGQKTVSIFYELSGPDGPNGQEAGRLEVTLSFKYLLRHLNAMDWWRTSTGYLVDATGKVLASTLGADKDLGQLGEDGDPLGLATLQAMLTQPSGTMLGPGHPSRQVAGFYRLKQAPWTLVLVAPGEVVLAPVMEVLQTYALVAGACVVLVVVLIWMVTGKVAGSVRRVCMAARQVAAGDYQEVEVPRSNDEFHRLAESFNTMVGGLREKDLLRQAFGRYVDQDVAKRLLARPEATRLGGESRKVAIMMSDIRGFTPLAAKLGPEQTVTLINKYLALLIEVIKDHGGIIVDFLGDAVLVFFDSLDEDYQKAVHRCACCAYNMCQTTIAFNQQERDAGQPVLGTGIGLNAGQVVVGNIGSETRAKYGIIGGPVNLTHRIQAQAGAGEILVSPEVRRVLGQRIQVGPALTASLKGIEQEVKLYPLQQVEDCPQSPQAKGGAPCGTGGAL